MKLNMEEKLEGTKWVLRNHKSKKNRQCNVIKNKDKETNNDLQNISTTKN